MTLFLFNHLPRFDDIVEYALSSRLGAKGVYSEAAKQRDSLIFKDDEFPDTFLEYVERIMVLSEGARIIATCATQFL